MIKIEVTGSSVAEVADKLMSLGANLMLGKTPSGKVTTPVGAIAELLSKPVSAPEPEVAEAAPADPTLEIWTGGAVPPVEPAPEPAAPEPTTSAPSAEASASELDFDTDVAPYVLQVVKEKGKPVAQEILSQFGVDRASLLEPHLWPELVEQLKGAL